MSAKKLSEIIMNIILILAGASLWLSAQNIAVGAAMGQGGDFMPKLCSSIWLLVSGLLLIFSLRAPDEKEKTDTSGIGGFLITAALLFVYILLLKPVGFVITSAVYMFAQMMLFVPKEYRSKKNYIMFAVISITLPIGVNALFANVFSLILPTGIL